SEEGLRPVGEVDDRVNLAGPGPAAGCRSPDDDLLVLEVVDPEAVARRRHDKGHLLVGREGPVLHIEVGDGGAARLRGYRDLDASPGLGAALPGGDGQVHVREVL